MASNRSQRSRRKRGRSRGIARETSGIPEENLSRTLSRSNPKFIEAAFRLPLRVDMPTGMVGLPDSVRVALKYSQIVAFTGSAAPAAQTFAINSLFDPDFSGTGHQPSFFDFWSSAYSRYCVLGASAILWIENETTTNTGANFACCYSDVNVSAQNTEFITESNRSKSGVVGPAGSMNVKKVVMPAITMAQLMGQPAVEPDDNMYAAVSASPTDPGYMVFRVSASDSASTITVRVKFTILFDAVFKDVNPGFSS